jgi:pimeloyl-ACP methyl ester carboxylesterase
VRQASAVICGSHVQYWHSEPRPGGLLVALHGLGADHRGLLDMLGHTTSLTVVVPDLPGFGASEPLRQPHTLENYAAFVDGLRRHLGVERAYVTGHSLGASIALVHAGRYPDTVRRLVLFNPVSEADRPTARLGKAYYVVGARLRSPLDRWWLTSRAAVRVTDSFVIRTKDRARRRAILAYDYDTYRRADLRAMKESFLSYYDTPFTAYAARIAAPTLFVTGRRDQLAPPAAVGRLQSIAPDSTLAVIEQAGHLFPAEQPAHAGALLNRFLTPGGATVSAEPSPPPARTPDVQTR